MKKLKYCKSKFNLETKESYENNQLELFKNDNKK